MGPTTPKETGRIDVLDFLRGVASVSVALFHFCNVLGPGALYTASTYGKYGVQVFFVISGFIIPYSLHRGGYRIGHYFTFVLKRVTRLDPPYLVTICIVLALGFLSRVFPFQKDLRFEVSAAQVLLHLGYLNTFFGYPWLVDIFWSLAIEFQYYLLMGLVFPLVVSRRALVRLPVLAALGALSFAIPSAAYVFYFLFLFLMGIATFQYRIGLIGGRQLAALLAVVTACSFVNLGIPATVAGSATVCAILFFKFKGAIFTFFGNISYSLYLLHSPVGRRALNVGLRLTGAESEAAKLVAVLFALGVSVLAAYALYRAVEKPSQRLSASFGYRRGREPVDEMTAEQLDQLSPAL
jgi:peptidoglycan/LPS O-acetylase OafA/YrhL